MRFSPATALSVLVLGLAACAESGGPTAPEAAPDVAPELARIAWIAVSPSPLGVTVGNTAQARALVYDNRNNLISGEPVAWSVADTNLASVSPDGVVSGKRTGSTTLRVVSGRKSAWTNLNVTAPTVSRISVTPPSASVPVGGTAQLTATAYDQYGNSVTVGDWRWESSNWSVVSVSATGLVTGKVHGSATITASTGGKTVSATVNVEQGNSTIAALTVSPTSGTVLAGSTLQLVATARDAQGTVLSGRVMTWSTSDATVATVDASGLVTGKANGSATITVAAEGRTATATLTVGTATAPAPAPAPAPVATVTVTPTASSIYQGQGVQLQAALRDANGNVLTGRAVTWTSSNAGVASVSSTGYVTAGATGSAVITATSEGKSGTASVTVGVVPVASVTVSPASVSLQPNGTAQLGATVRNAAGDVLSARLITWSSSNTTVATVSATGFVTALAAGSATITATSEGKTGSATVSVTAPPPPPPISSTCVAPNLLATLGFENGITPAFGQGANYWTARNDGSMIVSDPTASGGKSFQTTWQQSPASEQNAYVAGVLAQGVTRVHARWRYKQASNFENRGIIKKMFRTQGPGYNGLLGSLIIKDNRFVWFYDQLDAYTNYTINVGSEAGFTPNDLRGGWHTYEVMNDISTSGALRVRLWIDGVLKMDLTVAKSNLGKTMGVAIFGGTFNLPGQAATDWMDDLAVSTNCIGG
jgi:uncharacterized protein YjdB